LHSDEDVHLLGGEEAIEYMPTFRTVSWKSRYRPAIIMILIAILLVVSNFVSAWLGATHSMNSRRLPPIMSGKDPVTSVPNSWFGGGCGVTSATARAKGCQFNTVLYAWLEPKCLTTEDVADEEMFYAEAEFPWETVEPRRPITREEAFTGDAISVLTNVEWHIKHCTYVWQRLHRSLLNGTPIDSYTADYHHTTHCQEMVGDMMRNGTMSQNPTRVYVKYPSCA
jgi:hypothetical protein